MPRVPTSEPAPQEVTSAEPEQVARRRARRALEEVERAARSITDAAELLAPVTGAARVHARLLRLRRLVDGARHRIDRLFDRPLSTSGELERIAARIETVAGRLAAIASGGSR